MNANRIPCVAGIVVVLLIGGQLAGDARGAMQSKRDLVGVWELASVQDLWPSGTVTQWLGKAPTGVITYTPSGRSGERF
jgi:hypothetical protein